MNIRKRKPDIIKIVISFRRGWNEVAAAAEQISDHFEIREKYISSHYHSEIDFNTGEEKRGEGKM